MTTRHTSVVNRLGELTLTADEDGLTGVYFEGHWHPPSAAQLGRRVAPNDTVFALTATQLQDYLDRQRRTFELPISIHGTAFQRHVWELIAQIPYGERTTYGALARDLGGIGLSQRVGQCVGQNPLSIVVPCHRVVGADGALTGYAGGLQRKQLLLELESPTQQERLF